MLPYKQVSQCHKTFPYTKDPLTFMLGNQSCPKSFVSPSRKWTSGSCPKALTSSPFRLSRTLTRCVCSCPQLIQILPDSINHDAPDLFVPLTLFWRSKCPSKVHRIGHSALAKVSKKSGECQGTIIIRQPLVPAHALKHLQRIVHGEGTGIVSKGCCLCPASSNFLDVAFSQNLAP